MEENHAPLVASGNVAVITGAASGIGKAAAEAFAKAGMRLTLFDRDAEGLDRLAGSLDAEVKILAGDVSRIADLVALQDLAFGSFGRVNILMNNAAIGGDGSDNWAGLDAWHRILDVNLWGVVNGVHAFVPKMIAQGVRGAIVNTGSKQGITNPPGVPAYGTAKAAVKAMTEQLAHGLRESGADVTAHLLVPGWTYTGMTNAPDGRQPEGSWSAAQVVERMIAAIEAGDFYVLCPDNTVSTELDGARIKWSAGDLIENRPALSRWDPAWKDRFDAFVKQELGG